MTKLERINLIMLAALISRSKDYLCYRAFYNDRKETIDTLVRLPVHFQDMDDFLKYFDYLASDPDLRRELVKEQRRFDEWSTQDHDDNPQFWEDLNRMILEAKARQDPEEVRRAMEFHRRDIKFWAAQQAKTFGPEFFDVIEEVRNETFIDT